MMMAIMTKHHPDFVFWAKGNRHDYLPAAGHDALLPAYDLLARALGLRKVYRKLIAQAELTDAHRVLEIGCGTGNLTILVTRSHPAVEVIGSDPDPLALRRAQRKVAGLTGIRFEQGYAQQLPYADREFDRVLSSMMLHHLDDEAKNAAAGEIFRVLSPGGQLHLVDIGGEAIPGLLRGSGFDCELVDTHRHRVIGPLGFFRAKRPC